MADGEGDGDPREINTPNHGYEESRKSHNDIPSPGPSETNSSYEQDYEERERNGVHSDNSMDSLQERPLDFSVKRTEIIPVQNLNNKLVNGFTRNSNDIRHRNNHTNEERYRYKHHDQDGMVSPHKQTPVKTEAISPPPHVNGVYSESSGTKEGSSPEQRIGEPQLALPGMLPGAMLPGGAAGLLPILPPGLLPHAGLFNSLPLPHDMNGSKHGQNGKSGIRPLNHINSKDESNVPPPLALLSSLPQMAGMDLAAAQAMAVNSEEVFSQYKNYILALQQQFRPQKSPGGSSTSSSIGYRPSGTHSSIQSPSSSSLDGTPLPANTGAAPSSSNLLGMPTSPMSSIRAPYNPRMSSGQTRKRGRSLPEEQKDGHYWERRRKNNEAAKRSRDSRRAKEDEIAIRAAFLEQENLKLRVEVAALKNETAKLRCMLYNS